MAQKEKAPRCPMCGSPMIRSYVRPVVDGKQRYVPTGWECVPCRMKSWD